MTGYRDSDGSGQERPAPERREIGDVLGEKLGKLGERRGTDASHEAMNAASSPPTNSSTAAPADTAKPSSLDPFPSRHFEHLWSLGYGPRVIPIVPPGVEIYEKSNLAARKADPRGKVPGFKRPDGTWQGMIWLGKETTHDQLAGWQASGAGAGIRLGNGLVCIDADTLDKEAAKIIADTVDEHFGDCPIRIGNFPKAAYPIRVTGEIGYAALSFGEPGNRVELLTKDRQFVAYGIHPKTSRPYTWPIALPRYEDLPKASPDDLRAFLADLKGRLPAAQAVMLKGAASESFPHPSSLLGEPRHVKAALSLIPNRADRFGYDDYAKIGYATKASFPSEREAEALELFTEWALSWDAPEDRQNSRDNIAADWSRMHPPYRVGANWLYELALECTPGAPDFRGAKWFEPFDPAKPDGLNAVELAAEREQAQTTVDDDEIDDWLDADDLLSTDAPPMRWVIDGMLPDDDVTMLTGIGGAGKSLIAQQFATQIALGLPIFGHNVSQRRVMIFTCEDAGQEIHRRQRNIGRLLGLNGKARPLNGALKIISRRRKDNILFSWDRTKNTGVLTKRWHKLRDQAVVFGAKLLILDTIADIFGGDEINRTQVRQFVQYCAGGLADAIGGAVILIGHPSRAGEASGEGTSGSTAWHASVRSRLYFSHPKGKSVDPDIRVLEIMKANYGKNGQRIDLQYHNGAFIEKNAAPGFETVEAAGVEREQAALAILECGEFLLSSRSSKLWAGNAIASVYQLDPEDKDEREELKDILKALRADRKIKIVSRPDKNSDPRQYVEVMKAVMT